MPEAQSPPLKIAHLAPGEGGPVWDAYVGPRTTTVTELTAWRTVVREAYGINAHFLMACHGERVVGTLGLYQIRHPIFGRYLTTVPFGNDGGLHSDDADVERALVSEARRIADQSDNGYMVIRRREGALDGFRDNTQYCTSLLSLEGGAEAVWKRLPAKTRNQVRRGQKEGFSIRAGPDQLGAFHDVFHQHMRDLGSPAHSRKFYEVIADQLGARAEFLVVRDGRELVGGALLLRMNDTAANLHTVALRRFNRRCPNYLLYWQMIEAACTDGCLSFDMGRSRVDTPNLQFKSNWNPVDITLHYNYDLRSTKELPDLDPRNPAFRMKIALWRRLPLLVTRRLGPRLISGLG